MKLWNFLKKYPVVLSSIEEALLKNIRTNPNGWQVSVVNGAMVAHNRELSLVVSCRQSDGIAVCKGLVFGTEFSRQWWAVAGDMYSSRVAAEQRAEARATEAALKKALNVQ